MKWRDNGYLVVLIPKRVFKTLKLSDGLLVQGDYDLGDNWTVDETDDDESNTVSATFTIDTLINPSQNVRDIIDCIDFTVTSGNTVLLDNVDYEATRTYNEADDTYKWTITMLSHAKVVTDSAGKGTITVTCVLPQDDDEEKKEQIK